MALALPRYLPAAAAARVFIFAAAAGGVTTLGAIGVVATGRQRALPVLSGVALAINLACSMLALHFGDGARGGCRRRGARAGNDRRGRARDRGGKAGDAAASDRARR